MHRFENGIYQQGITGLYLAEKTESFALFQYGVIVWLIVERDFEKACAAVFGVQKTRRKAARTAFGRRGLADDRAFEQTKLPALRFTRAYGRFEVHISGRKAEHQLRRRGYAEFRELGDGRLSHSFYIRQGDHSAERM